MPSSKSLGRQLTLKPVVNIYPLTFAPDHLLTESLAQMIQVQASCMLVVEHEQLVGILTERDIIKLIAEETAIEGVAISEVMNSQPVTLSASENLDIFSVADKLLRHGVRHLPIIEQSHQIVGLVSQQQILDLLKSANFLKHQPVAQVMSTQLIQSSAQSYVMELAKTMAEQEVSCIVICEESNRGENDLLGIITEQDIVQLRAKGWDLSQTQVLEVLSTPLLTIPTGDSLEHVYEIMQLHGVSWLVALEETGAMAGIITPFSLLRSLEPGEMYKTIESLQQIVFEQQEGLQSRTQLQQESSQQQHSNENLVEQVVERTTPVRNVNVELQQELRLREAALKNQIWQERALRHKEERYRTLIETIPYGIKEIDTNGVITFSNAACHKMLGYAPGELIGKVIWDLETDDSAIELRQCLSELVRERLTSKTCFVTSLTKQGQEIDVQVDCSYKLDEQEQVTGFIVALADISEYKQVEEALRLKEKALRLSQERLDSILSSLEDVVWSIFPKTDQTLYLNSAVEKVYGRTVQEFFDNSNLWQEVVHPEDRWRVALTHQSLFQVNSTDLKYRIEWPNGEIRWLRERAQLIYNADGIPIRIDGISTDITQRQQAEEELRESEKKYRLIVETTHDGIWLLDKEAKTSYVNRQMAQMLGYSVEAMRGRSLLSFIYEEDRAEAMQYFERRKQGIGEQLDYRLLRKDGGVIWTLVSTNPIFDRTGQFQGVIGMFTDITERKKAEQALKESESKFRALFDKTFQFIWLLRPDGTVIEANQTALDFAGLALSDIAGKVFWQARWWTLSNQTQQRLQEAIKMANAGVFVRYEVDVRGIDDQVATIDFSLKPVWDEIGNVVLIIPEGRDISERQAALREHKRAEAATREAHHKEILLKEIHHRVKNNLQIVSGLLYLQSRYIDNKKTLQMLKDSQERIQAMALIHEKLYGSRNLECIDFRDYIQSLTNNLLVSYGCNPQTIKLTVNINCDGLDIDTAITCGLITNELVSNALKHAFLPGQTGKVTVEFFEREGNLFELIVRDNGIGISPDINTNSRKTLGMRLVNSLVTKQLKGKLELDQAVDTNFKISFNRKKQGFS